MGEQEEEGKKKRMVVESLGWMTESTIMPKKHRAITGVGASSIFELKAELYKSQEESKRSKEQVSAHSDHLEYQRAKKKIAPRDPLALKNSGVEARALKDKLELKAVNDGAVSYAALEKKAELYEKLARGELSDEEDKEKYCVDFFSKSSNTQDNTWQPQYHVLSTSESVEDGESDESMFNAKPAGLGRAGVTLDNNEHIRFVREVHEEASQAREKVTEVKLRRQEQATARREKLKQAYLRKQLEKLKAAKAAAENET